MPRSSGSAARLRLHGAAIVLAAIACTPALGQSTYYWTGTSGSYAFGGTGTWNAGTPWRISGTGGTLSSYVNGTNAVFFTRSGRSGRCGRSWAWPRS